MGFPGGLAVDNSPATQESQEMQIRLLGLEEPLEEGPTLYMCPEQAKHVRTGSGWWGEACLGREAGRPSGSWAPPR